jgi:hypothetical protein
MAMQPIQQAGTTGTWLEEPVLRVRMVVRRSIAAIVVAAALITLALTVTGAATAHHSLADNGVINSRD